MIDQKKKKKTSDDNKTRGIGNNFIFLTLAKENDQKQNGLLFLIVVTKKMESYKISKKFNVRVMILHLQVTGRHENSSKV